MTSKAEPAPPAQKKGSHTVRATIALPILVAVCIAAGGAYYWWQHHQPLLLAGISVGNGRIEADNIDIDTKFAGRVAQVREKMLKWHGRSARGLAGQGLGCQALVVPCTLIL